MLKYLSSNLNVLMAKARLNSNELARQINIPATTIKRIRNNEQANPTLSTLLPIAQYFAITVDKLIGNHSLLSHPETNVTERKHKIPLLSWQECAEYASLTHPIISRYVLTERNVSREAFALEVEGNDLDFFPKDSILIVEPKQKPETGDYVIVGNIQHNFASIRKYIVEVDQIYLKSLVREIGISKLTQEFRVLGVVIQYKVELRSDIK